MVDTDPRLVRLVARRFNDLVGLRTALIGILIMAASGIGLATRNAGATLLGLFGLVLLALYPMYRIERYYREQFGRVQRRDNTNSLFIVLAWFSAIFAIRPELAWLYWAFMSAYSVWALYDGWPYRRQELFVIAACACGAFLTSRNAGEVDLMPGLFLVGFAYVICGWADHKLLVRALHRPENVLSNAEYADTI